MVATVLNVFNRLVYDHAAGGVQWGEQAAIYSYLATLNFIEFTFSQGGTKLARRDQFWLPKLIRLDGHWRWTDFFGTGHLIIILLLHVGVCLFVFAINRHDSHPCADTPLDTIYGLLFF